MAHPEPGQLDHGTPQPRVPALRDALLAVDAPALPRARGQARIGGDLAAVVEAAEQDRKSTRLNSSHPSISYAVFCLKKKKKSMPANGDRRSNTVISPHRISG